MLFLTESRPVGDQSWRLHSICHHCPQVEVNRLLNVRACVRACVCVRARENNLPEKGHQPCVRTPVLQFVVKVHLGVGISLCLFGHRNRDVQAAAEGFNAVQHSTELK